MGGQFIASIEDDLLKGWRPAQQQPPAALGARPLFNAGLRRSRPLHLM
jgi:hypothetical protein